MTFFFEIAKQEDPDLYGIVSFTFAIVSLCVRALLVICFSR